MYPNQSESIYVWPIVVEQGADLKVFFSSKKFSQGIKIFKASPSDQDINDDSLFQKKIVAEKSFKSITKNSVHRCSPNKGCNWDPNGEFKIQNSWEPGVYRISFKGTDNQRRDAHFFVVNPKIQNADYLVLFDWMVLQNYNFFGGQNNYVGIQENQLKRTAKLKDNNRFRYSLKRPLLALNHLYPDSMSEPPSFEKNTKLIWYGQNFIKNLKNLGFSGQVYPNNWELIKDRVDFKKFKYIFLSGVQEYLSLELITKLQEYIQSGGNLIIAADEFAFRRIRESGSQFEFYFDPRKDPKFDLDPLNTPTQFSAQIPIRDRFGVSVEYGSSFGFHSSSREIILLRKDHPLLADLDFKLLKKKKSWMPGASITRTANNNFCIQSETFSCSEQVVFLYYYENNQAEKTCCEDQKDLDFAIDGIVNHTRNSISKELFAPFFLAKVGTGTMTFFPDGNFLQRINFKKWFEKYDRYIRTKQYLRDFKTQKSSGK